MERIVEQLKMNKHRKSTKLNYYGIWKNFNEFFIKLDIKPETWEDRLILFVGYLIDTKHCKANTVKSYISAIKAVLMDDGITLNPDHYLLNSLTKACRYKNDQVRTRLPIQKGMYQLLIDNLEEEMGRNNQCYTCLLFKAIFASAYYGMLRIGEIACGNHPIKAVDVHIGENKRKILFVLRTSKTHWKDSKPQFVRISSVKGKHKEIVPKYCPFKIINDYIDSRGDCKTGEEPFFVLSDHSAITPSQIRKLLKTLLLRIGVDPSLYSFHSFRGGRSVDLLKMKIPIPVIQRLGRWRSSAVYTYLANY